jgi:ATP-dependent DNA helicase RecG
MGFNGASHIHVFPQRLEIWNSGAFLNGVTSETIASGQISVLRNPDIAHVRYLRGLMEKTGRGGRLTVD